MEAAKTAETETEEKIPALEEVKFCEGIYVQEKEDRGKTYTATNHLKRAKHFRKLQMSLIKLLAAGIIPIFIKKKQKP